MIIEDINMIPVTFMIPYYRFNKILYDDLMYTHTDPIDIYINLDRILYMSLSKRFISNNSITDPKLDAPDYTFAASLINVLLHYKHFFDTNANDCRIIYYHTDYTRLNNMREIQCYDRYINRLGAIHEAFIPYRNTVIELLHTIIPYISKCYIIKSSSTECTAIPYIIRDENRKSLILSNYKIDTQYYNIDGFDMYYINRGNKSNAIDIDDTIKEYMHNYYMYLFLLLLLDDPMHKLDKISKRKINPCKFIPDSINNHLIPAEPNSIYDILKKITDIPTVVELDYRYALHSVIYKSSFISENEINIMNNAFIDLSDPDGLNDLNKRYFNGIIRTDFI